MDLRNPIDSSRSKQLYLWLCLPQALDIIEGASLEDLQSFHAWCFPPEGRATVAAEEASHSLPSVRCLGVCFGSTGNNLEVVLGYQKIRAVGGSAYFAAVEAVTDCLVNVNLELMQNCIALYLLGLRAPLHTKFEAFRKDTRLQAWLLV